MSRIGTKLLLEQLSYKTISNSSIPKASLPFLRPFSQAPQRPAENTPASSSNSSPSFQPKADSTPLSVDRRSSVARDSQATGSLAKLGNIFSQHSQQSAFDLNPNDTSLSSTRATQEEPHHFHIYSTRHNTHITLTNPDRTPIISLSCGNIGFRKAGRKTYDSAFQLASYVMGRITEQGIHLQIKKLELVLRGFGQGREAVTKALMGSEGRFLRGKVVRVQDATRLKFGGTRSKKPRRLG
ncbi:hypothetical protein BP5796_00122 [Coleophoma crateriformis]|uniref:Small ribosomal subunit protein uS11m n=1 Tax=Coleophoma crateriformis TaxID=565419 RepID=A0A3D8T745_9HELO|nr:hypothetical protein BP5796_00122 [Coleophoma crateriformis]